MDKNLLKTSVKYLKGVGPKRAELLASELNIRSFEDLLFHFPFRYVDKSKFYKVNEVVSDQAYVQLIGTISQGEVVGTHRAKRFTAVFRDDTGSIDLVWFKGIKFFKDKFTPNTKYIVYGKPSIFSGSLNFVHPEVEEFEEKNDEIGEKLQAVYTSTEKLSAIGLNSRGILKLQKNLLLSVKDIIPEVFNEFIMNKYKFINRKDAFISVHFPRDFEILEKARARLKFEEFFFLQLEILRTKIGREQNIKGNVFSKVGSNFNEFYKKHLAFDLTNAQKKVIKEIRKDFGSGRQMNRLLQGDVGSGKTVVALLCMLIAIDNGFQTAIMAPTEILAQQHFASISSMLQNMNISVELLTGSTKVKKRREIAENLVNGSLKILIGTHALIEDKVKFSNLGFVVIDEQHRFGVQQRAKMWKKAVIPPHILVMTATPIPRTMAMTLYGDLDISVIDELPPGRKSIKTFHYFEKARLRLFDFLKQEIDQGRQVYIVYPLIKESETLDLKNLEEGYEAIEREFQKPHYKVGIMHGQMKAEDKNLEMKWFKEGKTDILVSTTVIEVGVDVPNASIMVIENAERFGLSQLHQLRGRVGRGNNQSYCILMSSYKLSSEGKIRLDTMVRTSDGFEIAEVDLKLRGPGDIQGTQQSGILNLKIADIVKDNKMLGLARSDAAEILKKDPNLADENNTLIKKHFTQLKSKKVNWALIS